MLGMWMWPGSVQKYGADKVAERCARAGVTDLFFLVKGLAGTVAFRSRTAPMLDERDLLAELLSAAHERGVRVHAWFTSACDAHYKQRFPESGRCHFVRGKDRELISLRDEGYLHYMEQVVCELCSGYEIDGLHLDYIRYNHLLYGWAEEDVAGYRREGADPEHLRTMIQRMFYGETKQETLLFDALRAGDESVLALAHTRRRDVVHFAEAITQAAKSQKNRLVLSAALMPEGAYEDTAFSDLHYGQNYGDMAKIFEYALPMAYSEAYAQDGQWVKKVAEGTMKSGMKTLVGLHAYEGGTGLSLKRDLTALKDTPAEGVCLFREGATALAYAQGRALEICNALEERVTAVAAAANGQEISLQTEILPGEEKRFVLPFEAQCVRVFTAERERCVYLA